MHEVNRKDKTRKNKINTRAGERDEDQSMDKITKAKRKQISIAQKETRCPSSINASMRPTIDKNVSPHNFQLRLKISEWKSDLV